MNIQKLANKIEAKISLASTKDVVRQAMALTSAVINDLTIYDPGYNEARQLAGILFGRWQANQQTPTPQPAPAPTPAPDANSDDDKNLNQQMYEANNYNFDFPDIADAKKLGQMALEKLTGPNREKMMAVVRLLNSI